MMRVLKNQWFLGFVSAVIGVAIWSALSVRGVKNLPDPALVAHHALQMAGPGGTLPGDTVASLRRVLIGFALGVAVAIPVGFAMGWYPVVRGLVDPWVQFFRMIPPLALIPLVIVLLGIGETPRVFVIFLAAFLTSVVSVYQGVVSVDPTLISAARVLGAKDRHVFIRVVVPSSTPFILVGMRIALGASWATVVASELIAAQAGLGYRMEQAQTFYDVPTIVVDLIVIGILGLIMDRLVLLADRKLAGWQERR